MQTLAWIGETEGLLRLLDQTRLPTVEEYLDCRSVDEVWKAIRRLSVRGAPAIGIAAAYGVVIGAASDSEDPAAGARAAAKHLATSRPTAVNLFWALRRMESVLERVTEQESLVAQLLREARQIHDEDREQCRQIGRHGAVLLQGCRNILTHCNAGGLATSEFGTALAPIYTLHNDGSQLHVFADETRPLLQGARLTAWELAAHGVPVTVICDSVAATVMGRREVDAVIVGADRIAANGDVANKIGTLNLAILAKHFGIPFYVAAPTNTFDLDLISGDAIPIEQREGDEVARVGTMQLAPQGAKVLNPAFDVTPASLVTAIITERGVINDVSTEGVANLLAPNR